MKPTRLTKRELLTHLRDILSGVESGDTLEGNFTWTLPERGGGWDVLGSYRVGNTEGQGGMVTVGQEDFIPPVFSGYVGEDGRIGIPVDPTRPHRPLAPGTKVTVIVHFEQPLLRGDCGDG